MKRYLKKLIPRRLKSYIRSEFAAMKQPRMIYGYYDASGEHRARTRISDTTYIHHPERVLIGDNDFVWHYTIIDGTGGVEIGEGSQIGAWVGLFTHSSHISIRILGNHYQEVPEDEKNGYQVKPVKIGKYVFIGAAAIILPGVTIGDGALVASGSIVARDVPPFSIVRGNPPKVVGDVRKLDEPYLADEKIRRWYEEWQSD